MKRAQQMEKKTKTWKQNQNRTAIYSKVLILAPILNMD